MAEMKRTQRALGMAGWLGSAAGLILMPKCALCVSAYVLLGSGALWAGRDICGGPSGGPLSAFVDRLKLPPVVTLALSALSVVWIGWKGGRFVLRQIRSRRRDLHKG